MTRKRSSKTRKPKADRVSATATAKIEATARASYTVSKNVQQTIPEDVTRARSNAWLELISPITEWAGLKADAIRAKRAALRIQQEAALHKLAQLIRLKMLDKEVIHPIPVKILIPALEHASLEAPESDLLQWWANLLVSGATKNPLRPYLADLLNKIGPEEAVVLDRLWTEYLSKNWKRNDINVRVVKNDASYLFGNMIAYHNYYIKHITERETLGRLEVFLHQEILTMGQKLGIPIGFEIIKEWNVRSAGYTRAFDWLEAKRAELEVCQALRLADRHQISNIYMGELEGMTLHMWHLTELGFELMQACKPREQMQLEEYKNESHDFYIETEFKKHYQSARGD